MTVQDMVRSIHVGYVIREDQSETPQLFSMGNLNFTQIKFCARRKTRNFLSLSVPRRTAHYRVK